MKSKDAVPAQVVAKLDPLAKEPEPHPAKRLRELQEFTDSWVKQFEQRILSDAVERKKGRSVRSG